MFIGEPFDGVQQRVGVLPRLADINKEQQHKVRRLEFHHSAGGGCEVAKVDEVEYSIDTMPAYIKEDVVAMGVPKEWAKLLEAATLSIVSPPKEGGREAGGEQTVQ